MALTYAFEDVTLVVEVMCINGDSVVVHVYLNDKFGKLMVDYGERTLREGWTLTLDKIKSLLMELTVEGENENEE